MARKARICRINNPHGVPVCSKASYRKLCSLLGAMLIGHKEGGTESFLSFVRTVRERLAFFLDMIDACDVLYEDFNGSTMTLLVLADNVDHLDLIRNAIAQERRMLDELGIDPRTVDVDGDKIRISVPAPSPERVFH